MMTNKKELNIFIENICNEFEPSVDLRVLTDNTKKMLEFFLNNQNWIEKSCLKNEEFDTISFDIVLCDNKKIHEINREYRNKDCNIYFSSTFATPS